MAGFRSSDSRVYVTVLDSDFYRYKTAPQALIGRIFSALQQQQLNPLSKALKL